ncbi:hypothetical protein F511_38545 [Dorcoceras hygrometricum]|uniref:Uncharacterized protein n=1 Tax=Dorcoceras hygrometricum TaxID=472368 RepID=A0A2Z7DDZ5_9LAMI|nr:hypothetical protein F511_38545 [Dorcoceras hygrometricum]
MGTSLGKSWKRASWSFMRDLVVPSWSAMRLRLGGISLDTSRMVAGQRVICFMAVSGRALVDYKSEFEGATVCYRFVFWPIGSSIQVVLSSFRFELFGTLVVVIVAQNLRYGFELVLQLWDNLGYMCIFSSMLCNVYAIVLLLLAAVLCWLLQAIVSAYTHFPY